AGRPDRPLPRLMKIALVGPAHPYKGGGARHTTELAHRLAAAGHDVIIESWRAQYPSRLYPGQQTVDVSEGEPYPRTHRRLAWYRPAGWPKAAASGPPTWSSSPTSPRSRHPRTSRSWPACAGPRAPRSSATTSS